MIKHLKHLLILIFCSSCIIFCAQGISCDEAVGIDIGMHFADGPSNGSEYVALCFGGNASRASWYKIINLPMDHYITVSSAIDPNGVDTRLNIYNDDCSSLVCIASDDDNGPGNTSIASFFNDPGVEYLIEWDDRWSADDFQFEITIQPLGGDDDGDGVDDVIDNCIDVANPGQEDIDEDGFGDVCDEDIDGDGVLNVDDCSPSDGEVFEGAPCDDGNPETLGDSILDDCTCVGFIPLPGEYCETAVPASPGFIMDNGPNSGLGAFMDCGAFESATSASWYVIEATEPGSVRLGSCLGGVDTRVSVYRGSCTQLFCVAVSDDECIMSEGSEEFASYVEFDMISGFTYFIQWDDIWSSDAFTWFLEIDEVPECPELQLPEDGEIGVFIDQANNNSVDLFWTNSSENAVENALFLGTEPSNLVNLGSVGGEDITLTLLDMDFETTYYWSIVPANEIGSPSACSVYSFTTGPEDNTDTDDDGVVDAIDCDPIDPEVYQGASCDDGDNETYNDIILNNCTCEGALPFPGQYCETAVVVEEGTFSNAGAVYINGFNNACFLDTEGAIWYHYTASADGVAEVSSDGTEVDTRLSVFQNCDAENCLYSSDDIAFLENPASKVNFLVNEGDVFYIQWDNYWSNDGFDFSITLDESMSDADGDGILDGIDNCNDVANEDQADLDMDAIGDLCDLDIDGDLVENDEDCAPLDPLIFPGAACDDGNALTYNDQIQTDCNCSGSVAESNTSCVNSIIIDLGEHSTVGPVVGEGASNICFSGGDHAVWYQYDPNLSGILTISSANSAIDTRLSVYNSCPAVNCLGSNDDVDFPSQAGSLVNVPVIAGQSYWIEWDDPWTSQGFDFTLSFVGGDSDGDGIPDIEDNCPYEANPDQADLDGDGIGNSCDIDADGDGVNNNVDCSPLDAALYPLAICDDGNPSTENDVISADCSCQGTVPAINQTCLTAIEVGEGSFTDPGPFAGDGASNICETGATSANWYRYTPSQTGYAVIYSCIDVVDTRISVYNDNCSDLSCIAFSDDEECGVSTEYASAVVFNVVLGESYLFEWDNRWSNEGFNFVIVINSQENDADGDGIVDLEDNCFEIPNPDQADLDFDFVGDVCDDDLDGDLVSNDNDCDPLDGSLFLGASCSDDNPLTTFDSIQEDCTCQGIADDDDTDEDGILDVYDNCIGTINPLQEDLDNDGFGDECDPDIDGDFILNEVDCDPLDGDVSQILGSACDDGMAETIFDEIQIGCTCSGVIPANNPDCESAIAIGVGVFETVGPVAGAGASNMCGSIGADAVWYEFIAEQDGIISISSSNDLGMNTNLAVYDDCDGTCLGSNDDISDTDLGSNVILEVVAGESYFIEWDDLWSMDGFQFTIDFVLGINQFSEVIQDVNVYPNPTSDFVTVQFNSLIHTNGRVSLYDATGRAVFNKDINTTVGVNELKVALSDFNNGIFVLKFFAEEVMFTKRIILID